MCSTRILCRLRFIANNRNIPKQPFKEVLQEAMKAVRQLRANEDKKILPIADLFVMRAKEVIKLLDSWAKHQTPAQLGELVEGVYRTRQVGQLHELLNALPNRAMGPTSRGNLLNIVSKVARYREAARFLYRTAKQFPLVRKMKVVLVNLPQTLFHEIQANKYTPTLRSTLSRISPEYGEQDLGYICRLLNTTKMETNEKFAQQTTETLKKARIHAEIQLLVHCELKVSKLPPRVVCSSKDACFLCNAFILVHGKMHTPRFHGRLYPGWRLPFFPKANDIERRFNQLLENYIRNSLTTLLSRRQRTVYPCPNESTLLTLPLSVSTKLSSAPLEPAIETKTDETQPRLIESTVIENSSSVSSSIRAPRVPPENTPSAHCAERTEAAMSEVDEVEEANTKPLEDIASHTVPSIHSSRHSPSSTSLVEGNDHLLQGQILSRSIKIDRKSRFYTAGSLEVQFEHLKESELVPSRNTPAKLAFSIEWLTFEEAEALREHHPAITIDAELLDGEISISLDDRNCFYIAARGSVLKICVHRRAA
jgi:OTT_1508-like deaminase